MSFRPAFWLAVVVLAGWGLVRVPISAWLRRQRRAGHDQRTALWMNVAAICADWVVAAVCAYLLWSGGYTTIVWILAASWAAVWLLAAFLVATVLLRRRLH